MLFADRLKETAKLIVIVKSMTRDKHEKVHLSSPLLSSLPLSFCSPSPHPLSLLTLLINYHCLQVRRTLASGFHEVVSILGERSNKITKDYAALLHDDNIEVN